MTVGAVMSQYFCSRISARNLWKTRRNVSTVIVSAPTRAMSDLDEGANMGFMRGRLTKPAGPRPGATVVARAVAAASAGERGRTAPESVSLVLPALAALGAISSIAAVAYLATDREGDRQRVKRRGDSILKDLETSCLGIAEILRRLKRRAHLLGIDGPAGAAALKFGLNAVRVDAAGGPLYHQLVNDMATMLVLATQSSVDVMSAIEDGEIEASDEMLEKFAAAQEQLNALLVQRAGIRPMVDGCLDVAQRLAIEVTGLRRREAA